jgi:hypothetical protein
VLSRVRNFLPQMRQANIELEQKIKESPSGVVDIENVNENSESYIEMVGIY